MNKKERIKKKMLPNIPELMKKIPEFTKRAELHGEITVKILEIVDEINQKMDTLRKMHEEYLNALGKG